MQLFLDTADLEEVKQADYIIDGVTTNPTLIARAGKLRRGNFIAREVVTELCEIMKSRPVSVELMSEDKESIIKEAKQLAKIAKNIVVKIPMTAEGMTAIKALEGKVKTNVTLVFSVNQALLAAKAGAGLCKYFYR